MAKWRGCIIVSDHDRKFISVHGPMTDDSQITAKISEAQRSGRKINCCSADENPVKAETEAKQLLPDYQIVPSAL